jgi:hypothetical protein
MGNEESMPRREMSCSILEKEELPKEELKKLKH